MIHRFLIAGCVAAFMCSFDFGAGRLKTNGAWGAEQKSTTHSAPSYRGGGHPTMSYGNASRSASVHSSIKTGGHTAGSPASTMAAHAANPVLKGQVLATSSKVQQQLYASGTAHQQHLHHHWHWGEYSYLPTNSSSVVIAVPNGNTLTVSTAGAVTPNGMLFENRHNHTGTASARARAATANSALASTVIGSNINLNLGTNLGTVRNVRLAGVAAPLSGQSFSSESQQHLTAMAMGKHVRIFQTGIDSNGTIVGQVFLSNSGTNLNERQLRDGMAFNSVNDGFASSLAAAEEAALAARTGLWHAKHPIAPWLVTP
jgi:endonuclease YncB( thermonuclease family)